MPKVIALTGNIASGKSTAGEILQQLGISVLDSDEVVAQIYANDSELEAELLENFGTIDKKELAAIIFGDSEEAKFKRKLLESLIHPRVDKVFNTWLEENKEAAIVVNLIPLVFEAGLEDRYDHIVTITCSAEDQIERLKLRHPDWTEEEIQARIDSQMSQEEKLKRSDFILSNLGSEEDLRENIKNLLKQLR